MMLPFVLVGVVVCVVLYLAWVYYFLFYKEKPKKAAPGIFNLQNEELFFPQAKKKSGTGKFAVTGLFLAAGRRRKNEKEEVKAEDRVEEFPKNEKGAEGLHNVQFTDTKDTKEVREEKSVHFETEASLNSPVGHDREDNYNYRSESETDQGYGTLPANNDGGSGSW